MNVIETKNVTKRYGTFTALDDLSLNVKQGEVIGLLGPNGAGKTTLMKALVGYHQPDAGEISIKGIDAIGHPVEAQRYIGYLPESAPLYSDMAVQEYLQMIASLRDCPIEHRQAWLSDAIFSTGIEDYLTRPIRALSKGYRQRVGIAQAILHRPDLLILDEPTTGLDPNQIVEIRELISRLAERSTVVLSTHILSEVEMSCERVLILMNGQLRADASVAELRESNTAFVSIATDAAQVRESLLQIEGANDVEKQGSAEDGYQRWRISSSGTADLCPAIFDVVREKNWRIAELRTASRTLESVFRELADTGATEALAA